jgi:hypothetical protein
MAVAGNLKSKVDHNRGFKTTLFNFVIYFVPQKN